MHYFGRWDNWQKALDKYLAGRDDLEAGRTPQPKAAGVTVADLVNAFLVDRRHLLDTRELAERSWHDYWCIATSLTATEYRGCIGAGGVSIFTARGIAVAAATLLALLALAVAATALLRRRRLRGSAR